jgi:hypothetical protein
MSANNDFQNAIDTLVELREIGHDMPDFVANSIIDALTRAARQMVNRNRLANGWDSLREPEPVLTLQRPQDVRIVSPPRSPVDTPPPTRMQPNTPPPILRNIRPSQVLQQIRELQPDPEPNLEVRDRVLTEEEWFAQLNGDFLDELFAEENARPWVEENARPWAEEWAEHKARSHTVRAISRKRFEEPCKQDCVICFDRHTAGESIVTECGHEFGTQCWETWMNRPDGNHGCPNCRKQFPKTHSFKLRADRRPKNANQEQRNPVEEPII